MSKIEFMKGKDERLDEDERGDGVGRERERAKGVGANKNSWGNIRIDVYRASEGMLGNERVC